MTISSKEYFEGTDNTDPETKRRAKRIGTIYIVGYVLLIIYLAAINFTDYAVQQQKLPNNKESFYNDSIKKIDTVHKHMVIKTKQK